MIPIWGTRAAGGAKGVIRKRGERPRLETLEGRVLLDCSKTIAAGALDPAFGAGGFAVTPAALQPFALVTGVAAQSDGKIVETGAIVSSVSAFSVNANATGQLFVARFNPDGKSLDPTFGNGGVVVTNAAPGDLAGGASVLVGTDGKILVGGEATPTSVVQGQGQTQGQPILIRYNPDGSLDTTFGQGGIDTAPLAPLGGASDLAFDGTKILVVGGLNSGSALDVVRLNADGSADQSFGTNGVASAQFGTTDSNDEANGVAVGPNGTIYVVGATGVGPAALAAFSPTGAELGLRSVPLGAAAGGFDALSGVVVQPNGQVVATGFSQSSGQTTNLSALIVARFNPDLSLDPTFGAGGIVRGATTQGVSTILGGLLLQPDGKIVTASPSQAGAVVRLTAAGQFDPTFGTNGVAQQGFTTSTNQLAVIGKLALDPITHNILVVGGVATLGTGPNQTVGATITPFLARLVSTTTTTTTPAILPQSVRGVLVLAPKDRWFRHPVALVSISAAGLSCFNPNDYRVVIRWGDGRQSTGVFGRGPGGSEAIIGAHEYRRRGVFHTTTTIYPVAGGAALSSSVGLIVAGGPSYRGPHRLFP